MARKLSPRPFALHILFLVHPFCQVQDVALWMVGVQSFLFWAPLCVLMNVLMYVNLSANFIKFPVGFGLHWSPLWTNWLHHQVLKPAIY